MAAAIAQNLCRQTGFDATVKSAGTTAEADGQINPNALMVLEEMGIPHQHKTHRLTTQDILDADVVFVMERKHLAQIQALFGEQTAPSKIMLLDDPEEIADPLGKGLGCYQETASKLCDVINTKLRNSRTQAH
jgi:protein-tyrosine-phosphatase